MKAPTFWVQPAGLLARLLQPLGWLYGAVTAWRMKQKGADAGVPVICIGNFTMGGAGKTPTAMHVAQVLLAQGRNPMFLSRGYGGRLAGPVLVDPEVHGAAECGDEPLLLSAIAPCVVARDRVAGARLARDSGANVLIMDDGLQNPALRKSLSIAVVDGAVGVGNGLCCPAGPLRAPLADQLPLVDAVLIIGDGLPGVCLAETANAAGRQILRASLVPLAADIADLKGQPLLAFAGIGRPEKFRETLVDAGLDVAAFVPLPDHHPHTAEEFAALAEHARIGGMRLVTTAKDAIKLGAAANLHVVRIALAPDGPSEVALTGLLSKSIELNARKQPRP